MKPLKPEPRRTQAFPYAGPKAMKPGMRALEACGDGFWECDLIAGSAWFSDWFYRKLGWPPDTKRSALCDLQPTLCPGVWDRLMATFRDHLEKGFPLDLEIEVEVPGERVERWRMRGRALRNGAGQPIYLAGSMREETAQSDAGMAACLGSAFEALPVAAALLDTQATVIAANQLWREFPEAIATQAIARLRAANSQTAIEFWVDEGERPRSSGRQLRVRAIAFQHEGSRHLAVTLEDRRSD
jgi:PAS domain-containing protein